MRKDMKNEEVLRVVRRVTLLTESPEGNHLQTKRNKSRKIHRELQGEGPGFFCFALFLERRWKGERESIEKSHD